MSDPVIIAALVLAGVFSAGLIIDFSALRGRSTRAYGASALCIKGVLGLGAILSLLRMRLVPHQLYPDLASDPMFIAFVAMSVPLMGVVLSCEILALPRLAPPLRRSRARRLADSEGAD